MPSEPKGKADSPAGGSTASPTTPTPPAESGALSRADLVELLQTAAPPDPEPEPATEPVAPPTPDAPDKGAAEPESPEGKPSETREPDLSQPSDDESPPAGSDEPAADEEAAGGTPGVQKRIDTLRRKLGDAERQVEELKARVRESETELAETRHSPSGQPPPAGAGLNRREIELETKLARFQRVLKVCRDNPDGYEYQGQTWTPEQLAETAEDARAEVLDAKRELRELRTNWANQERALRAEAEKRHPWLKDRSDERAGLIESAMTEWPALRQIPGISSILADALAWRDAQKARPAAKPAPKPPPPPPPPPASAPARVADANRAKVDRAREAYMKDGSKESLAEFLAAEGAR